MERDSETTRYYDHARHHEAVLGRFLSPDKLQGKPPDPQTWNRYAYARSNPLKHIDPNGLDAMVVTFPNYRIATSAGRLEGLGHAGIVVINNRNGATSYYEYGRYDTAGIGLVRQRTVPDVVMGKNGLPTEASMKRLMSSISRQSGQGGRAEGQYVKSDNHAQMVSYAEGRQAENSNPERKEYGLVGNNCVSFCKDTLEAGGVDAPSMVDPRPSSYNLELQESFGITYTYDAGQLRTQCRDPRGCSPSPRWT
jgi:RHS repeat-associated protein